MYWNFIIKCLFKHLWVNAFGIRSQRCVSLVLARAPGHGAVPRGADGVIWHEATGTELLWILGETKCLKHLQPNWTALHLFFSAIIVSACQALCLGKAYSWWYIGKNQTHQLFTWCLFCACSSQQNTQTEMSLGPAGNRSLLVGVLGREGQVIFVTFPKQRSCLKWGTVPSQHPSSPMGKIIRKAII